jgi:hypothetical protein
MPAAKKPRLVSSALSKGMPLVGSTGIDCSSSALDSSRRLLPCLGVRHIASTIILF